MSDLTPPQIAEYVPWLHMHVPGVVSTRCVLCGKWLGPEWAVPPASEVRDA